MNERLIFAFVALTAALAILVSQINVVLTSSSEVAYHVKLWGHTILDVEVRPMKPSIANASNTTALMHSELEASSTEMTSKLNTLTHQLRSLEEFVLNSMDSASPQEPAKEIETSSRATRALGDDKDREVYDLNVSSLPSFDGKHDFSMSLLMENLSCFAVEIVHSPTHHQWATRICNYSELFLAETARETFTLLQSCPHTLSFQTASQALILSFQCRVLYAPHVREVQLRVPLVVNELARLSNRTASLAQDAREIKAQISHIRDTMAAAHGKFDAPCVCRLVCPFPSPCQVLPLCTQCTTSPRSTWSKMGNSTQVLIQFSTTISAQLSMWRRIEFLFDYDTKAVADIDGIGSGWCEGKQGHDTRFDMSVKLDVAQHKIIVFRDPMPEGSGQYICIALFVSFG